MSTHPYGRVGINHAQPEVGIDYPLIGPPSDDIAELLADLWLEYEDPSDYDPAVQPYTPPFRISWLGGFGTDPATGTPTAPLNPADIIIVDADNRVVFNSRPTLIKLNKAWGPRLWLYHWQTSRACLTVIRHNAWGPHQTPRTYSIAFNPVSAVLHARTYRRLPRRIKTVRAVLTTVEKAGFELKAEYNMVLTPSSGAGGLRNTTSIRFDATPGSGLGVYPDCEDQPLVITTINGIAPTAGGHFFLNADDCYFVRQPVSVVDISPRTTYPTVLQAPYNTIDENLPDPLAGTTTAADGWPTQKEEAHLYLGNDCVPCCDCDDYVDAAQFIVREVALYKEIADDAKFAADEYVRVRDRFIAAQNCVTRYPIRAALQPQVCPYMDVVAQYCNQSDECLTNLELLLAFDAGGGTAVEVPGYTQIKGARYGGPGGLLPLTERYAMGGSWPNFTAFWEYVPPHGSVFVRMRLLFGNCGGDPLPPTIEIPVGNVQPYVVTVTVTGTANGVPLTLPPIVDPWNPDDPSPPPGPSESATATATAALRCPVIPADVAPKNICVLPVSPPE